MDNYRNKLKIDNIISSIGILALLIFAILAAYSEFSGQTILNVNSGNEHFNSMWRGFICGVACGIASMLVFYLVRNLLALMDDNKLKKLYIKENDEREKQICDIARSSAGRAFLLLGMVAGIIAGFYSVAVSITIIGCILFYSLASFGFMAYYRSKM